MDNSEPTTKLSPSQANALFDILTHHETYAEIEKFKGVDAINSYGPPFQNATATKSTSPILQILFTHFALTLPGARDVPQSFWTDRIHPLVAALASANLSESFDKGEISQRRTLATAVSALLEYIARGVLGGLPRRELEKTDGEYDASDPDDLAKAWHDMLQQLVYGDLLDELAQRIAETDQLSEHKTLVQAAHRYILINVASLIHYILIVSSRGPALLSLLESVHRLVPYLVIRQTLKVGNAATMISGMVRIVLAKASVGAVTNWLGLSQGVDEGMNLMQTIIWTVLGWDARKFKSKATQVEKEKHELSKEQQGELREYTKKNPEEQEVYRIESRVVPRSLVVSILNEGEQLSDESQELASSYLAAQLSIRDRQELTAVLCNHRPDLLTPVLRALVNAYDPIIRRVHNAIDLSAGLSDAESFLNDLISLSKHLASDKEGKSSSSPRVSVQSYVTLLEKHQSSVHRFLHQFAKNDSELLSWYISWCRNTISEFRIQTPSDGQSTNTKSNDATRTPLPSEIAELASQLSEPDRKNVLQELDIYSAYLATLSSNSAKRAKAVLTSTEPSSIRNDTHNILPTNEERAGPGIFLAKWQSLLDDTETGPPAVHSSTQSNRQSKGALNHGEARVEGDDAGISSSAAKSVAADAQLAPGMENTIHLLGPKFHELLQNQC